MHTQPSDATAKAHIERSRPSASDTRSGANKLPNAKGGGTTGAPRNGSANGAGQPRKGRGGKGGRGRGRGQRGPRPPGPAPHRANARRKSPPRCHGQCHAANVSRLMSFVMYDPLFAVCSFVYRGFCGFQFGKWTAVLLYRIFPI